MLKENWKTVIASSGNLIDAVTQYAEEYEMLKDFYDEQCNVDDSTWVHVDDVKAERDELESKIQHLEVELEKKTALILELQQYILDIEKDDPEVKPRNPLKKKTLKKKKVGILDRMSKDAISFKAIDDDIPF